MYQAAAIGSAVGAFKKAADSGQVSIQAEAAEEALTEMRNIKDQLTNLVRAGTEGATDVQLGANPVGEAMANKSMSRYDGGDSFMAVLALLLEQTERAENALDQSIRNYVSEDELRALNLGGTQA